MPITKLTDTTYKVDLLGGDKVEVGDKDLTEFKPHVKFNRWDGEGFIKLGLPTGKTGEPVIDGNTIKWIEPDLEADFYPIETRIVIVKNKDGEDVEFKQCERGGFEFEVILKKKPLTNKIVLDMETQGLVFHYQPPLTQEEIEKGCIRPDNVVGSYAVYHSAKSKFHSNTDDAEKYKCGKAFHIYRPKITDAEGNWIWGAFDRDAVEVKQLIITIDQEWLDNAHYPIVIDPTFGYTDEGASSGAYSGNDIYGSLHTAPANGIANSISAYGTRHYDNRYIKGVIADHNDLTILADGVSDVSESYWGISTKWLTAEYSSSTALVASHEYVLGIIVSGSFYLRYDSGDTDQGHYDTSNDYGTPTDPTDAQHNNNIYSIYCTYTAETPPAGQPYTSRVQFVQGMRTWGGI